MPQYIPPVSNIADWNALADFTKGFIVAAFFCEANPDNPELRDAEIGDIAPESLKAIIADCDLWQGENFLLLERAYRRGYDATQAGHDYWFSRNGHGVGYWDREEIAANNLGDDLTTACQHMDVHMYRGDNGMVYFDGLES